MSEMIERVALILADKEGLSHRAEWFKQDARIIIAAMREPSPPMFAAVTKYLCADDARVVWQAMIDAALVDD